MKRFTVFFIVIFITACSNRTDVPANIIPPDSMTRIMKELIMAEQYSSQYVSKDSSRPDKGKASQDLIEAIFKLHHTTRAEFKNSLNFYESRPDLNKNIFDSLAADASRHKSELYAPRLKTVPAHTPVK